MCINYEWDSIKSKAVSDSNISNHIQNNSSTVESSWCQTQQRPQIEIINIRNFFSSMRKKKNIQNYPIHLLNAKQCLSSFISHMELKQTKPSEIKIFQNRLRSSYNIISFILSFSSSDFWFAIKKTHTRNVYVANLKYIICTDWLLLLLLLFIPTFSLWSVCVFVCWVTALSQSNWIMLVLCGFFSDKMWDVECF